MQTIAFEQWNIRAYYFGKNRSKRREIEKERERDKDRWRAPVLQSIICMVGVPILLWPNSEFNSTMLKMLKTACNVRPGCISFTYLAEKGRRYGVKLFVAPNLKIQKVLSSKTTIRASAETGSGTSAKEIEDHSRLPKVIRWWRKKSMTRDYRKCASAPIATNKIRQEFQHTNFLFNHDTTIYFETFREWFICLPLPSVDIFVASTFLQSINELVITRKS